jgi:uncharacterized protein YjbJ (UPF0337 family)
VAQVYPRPARLYEGLSTAVETFRDVSAVTAEKKAKGRADELKGRVKEAVGRAVGNERLTTEGRAQRAKGDTRQAKDKLKDVFRRH